MSTSRSTLALSEPHGSELIPEATFSYLRTRNRLHAFDLVQTEFDKAGITQAALAARMGKDPGQLNRLLSAPGNWTFDTFSDLLFSICGGIPSYSVDFPLDRPARNHTQPDWTLDNPPLNSDASLSIEGVEFSTPLSRNAYIVGADDEFSEEVLTNTLEEMVLS